LLTRAARFGSGGSVQSLPMKSAAPIFFIAALALCSPAPIQFSDTARQAGITFVVRDAATPERHQIEPMVGGVAVFDYNNDQRPDIYFVNGALYRNQRDGTFTDVTVECHFQK
jgi:enediyne biosynthesis protein E4